jgi:subtilisin family serine protease
MQTASFCFSNTNLQISTLSKIVRLLMVLMLLNISHAAMAQERITANFFYAKTDSSAYLENAVDYAASHGSLICACVGNKDSTWDKELQEWIVYTNAWYPAAYALTKSNVISIAATNNKDEKAYYSCYGPGIGKVTVAAPGGHYSSLYYDSTEIWSTYHDIYKPNDYLHLWGTSMATPFVSGLASLRGVQTF